MPESRPTQTDLEEEFARLRGALPEYPELRPIVDNLPSEVPDPEQRGREPGTVETAAGDQPASVVGAGAEAQTADVVVPRFEFRDPSVSLDRWRVSKEEKRQALQARQRMYQNRVSELNARLKQGRLNASQWFRQMRGEIRKLHLSAYGIGHSGKFDQLSQSDYGQVGTTVQRQYRFLQRWKQQLQADGVDSVSLAQLNDRAQKYGAAARESFEKGYQSEVGLDPSVLPAQPGGGTTSCRSRCKCRWAIQILSKDDGNFNATWRLGQAEHCVAASTHIHTAKGSHTVRRACNEGTKEIHTGNALEQTRGVVMSGTKPCVTITTEFGYELTCTKDHEVRVWDEVDGSEKWVRAEELMHTASAFQLMMQRGYQWENPSGDSVDVDLAELMGYMDGNGHVTELSETYADGGVKRQIGYTIPRRYERILERYQSAMEDELGFRLNVTAHSKSDKVWLVRSAKREAGEWAATEGLKNGTLPTRIRGARREVQASYLRGLFDADGHVDQRGMTVTLSSAERSFIRDVQDLLFGLGIVSKWRKSTRSTNYKEDRELYILRLLGGPNLQRFIDRVGFGCKEKREKLNDPERKYTTGDTYPLDWQGRSSFPMLRENIDEALVNAQDEQMYEKYQMIKEWVENEAYFANVETVQGAGEHKVYDVVESPTSAFLADGFVVHNCEECLARAMEWVQLEIRGNVLQSSVEPIYA